MYDKVTKDRRAVVAAALTAVMWGLAGIFVRLLPPMSPFTITTGRLLGALVVALPLFAMSKAKRLSTKKALTSPIGYALASLLAGYYLLATAAFQLAPVAEVALLLSTPPLFVLALRRIRGDGPTLIEILGAGFAVAAIALILGPRLFMTASFANARLIGNTLAICAAFLTALYAYLYRHMANTGVAPEPTSVTFLTFALGSAVLIGTMCLVPATFSWEAFNGRNMSIFLGLAVLCTAIPSFAFAFASERLPAVVTSTISLLIPLFAGAFAYVFLGEKVPPTAIPGSVLVIVGIVTIIRKNN